MQYESLSQKLDYINSKYYTKIIDEQKQTFKEHIQNLKINFKQIIPNCKKTNFLEEIIENLFMKKI